MISIVQLAVVAYIGYALLLLVFQRAMLFPGAARVPDRPADAALPDRIQRTWLEVTGGRVEAWLIEPSGSGVVPALMFAHGNGELIDDWTHLDVLTELGVAVMLVEFPGYGHSEGRPTRESIAETFRVAYDWLVSRPRTDSGRIVAMGRSLGGGAVTDLLSERSVRALILQSTFSSVAAMAWQAYKAPGFLVRDAFHNERAVRGYDGPVLVLHGRRDRIIPFSHAETLARAREGVRLVPMDCGHNDCPEDWDEFVGTIRTFLVDHAVLPTSEGAEPQP